MYCPDEIESANGWKSKRGIAALLQCKAVVAERDILFRGRRYKGGIKISTRGKIALFQLDDGWICVWPGKFER